MTCSGAPQAPLGGSWRLLGALGACKIKIHRPCRCLGDSKVTIYGGCQCLEASRNDPTSRSIVPVGAWRLPGWLLDVFGSSTSSSWRNLEARGGCRSFPVGVWEAHNSRFVVPVSVLKPARELRVTLIRLRPGFDGPIRWGSGARPSKIFKSFECLEGFV